MCLESSTQMVTIGLLKRLIVTCIVLKVVVVLARHDIHHHPLDNTHHAALAHEYPGDIHVRLKVECILGTHFVPLLLFRALIMLLQCIVIIVIENLDTPSCIILIEVLDTPSCIILCEVLDKPSSSVRSSRHKSPSTRDIASSCSSCMTGQTLPRAAT